MNLHPLMDAFNLASFGLVAITCAFLISVWGRLAFHRAQALEFKFRKMYRDLYMVLAVALWLSSAGTGLFFAARVWAAIFDHLGPFITEGFPGWLIAVGLVVLVSSKFGFMWAAAMDRNNHVWLLCLTTSVAWVFFSIWWVFCT